MIEFVTLVEERLSRQRKPLAPATLPKIIARLSDIAPDLGVPKGHQACFCDNHIQPARKIVMDCGVLEPHKLLEEFNRREANATGQLPGGKE